MDGQSGADTMFGGAGDDSYYVDNAGDVIGESSGSGNDTVYSSVSYGLGAFVERLNLTGSGNINGVGNVLANFIVGNSGDNTLFGYGGADEFSANGGNDTVYGGDGDDAISGDQGDDLLDGGNNNDTINGGDGIDTLYGRTGNDILSGNGDGDTIYGGDGFDQLFGGAGADLLDGGNDGDSLAGGDDNDTLYGRNGNDQLNGGLGADTLYGGNDADTFVFNSALGAGNIDVIADFNVAADTIELSGSIFSALNVGTLDANAFVIGAAAADADDRIIYDSTTGALFYDADGSGAGAAVLFATLAAGLALTNADFIIPP